MKLILLGAPGAGKGTQADIIKEKLSIPAISTGNIIRAAMKNETAAGKAAKEYVEKGDLVPDEIVVDMLKERLAESDCDNGFILDGFPRNVNQAETLSKMGVEIDSVLNIDVPDEFIADRMTGRRVCPNCGASFHVKYAPPKVENVCDKCGNELSIRKDDMPETVAYRLKVYHDETAPLIDYYKAKGQLKTIDGTGSVEATTELALKALEA